MRYDWIQYETGAGAGAGPGKYSYLGDVHSLLALLLFFGYDFGPMHGLFRPCKLTLNTNRV